MSESKTTRRLGTKQAEVLKRFAPEIKRYSETDEQIVPVFSNIEPSRRRDKPWWPIMDSLIKSGRIMVRKNTIEVIGPTLCVTKTVWWQAATSYKGYADLKGGEYV